jgi:hypothetical protein
MAGIDRDVEANLEQWESVFSDNDPAARLEELTGDKYQRFQVCVQRLHNGCPTAAQPSNAYNVCFIRINHQH